MADTKWLEIARTAAAGVGALDEAGNLKVLDSLALIDLIVELERLGEMEIPSEALRLDTFSSLATLAEALTALAAR